MNAKGLEKLLAAILLLGFTSTAFAHGLVKYPPSRGWFCGYITKPDHITNGTARYPECAGAFNFDWSGSYNFMSVLTHTQGRAVVGPRQNVCGFNSENWNGGATPWDQPIEWPTSNISFGPLTFTWDISWGPHFSDTEEFRYWITKPGFVWQTGRPLSFSDFEDQAFCVLRYDDRNPGTNPAVVPDRGNSLFHTTCNIPSRSGRHVIYAEWGRNEWTYERFHGCIDVVFAGSGTPPVRAQISSNLSGNEFVGSGAIRFDGSRSQGDRLSYRWSVDSNNPGFYTLASPNQSVTNLNLATSQAARNVTVVLHVSNQSGSDSASMTFTHLLGGTARWFDLGQLTTQPITLNAGDQVSVRTVSDRGQDGYWPSRPVTVTTQTNAAEAWAVALGQAVNRENGALRVGSLTAQDEVAPVRHATANRMYSLISANLVSGFLEIEAGSNLKAQYRAADTNSSDNQIKPHFNIVNMGATSIPLSELTVRYWYTREGGQQQQHHCDYARVNCSYVTSRFVALANRLAGADHYLEIGFTSGAGSVAAGGQTGEIQNRFNKTDWTNYDERDDYSFDPTKTGFADWGRVTLYRNAVLVWGTEPGGTPAALVAESQLGDWDELLYCPLE